jgi:hypothetical protein
MWCKRRSSYLKWWVKGSLEVNLGGGLGLLETRVLLRAEFEAEGGSLPPPAPRTRAFTEEEADSFHRQANRKP